MTATEHGHKYFATKYDSAHAEAVVQLAEMWADGHDYGGTTEAPCGSWLTYEISQPVFDALLEDLAEHHGAQYWQLETEAHDFLRQYPEVIPEIPGIYLIQYNDQGFVSVTRFETLTERDAAVADLDRMYEEWEDQ